MSHSHQRICARCQTLSAGPAWSAKNNEMIIFLCWLVLLDKFEHASMFVMLKGHTYKPVYTVLDQSFNTLISSLMNNMI